LKRLLKVCLTLGIAFLSQDVLLAQASHSYDTVVVSATRDELITGYLSWLHHHPNLLSNKSTSSTVSGQQTLNPPPFMVRIPSIDLYSSDGIALYHDWGDAQRNARFLQSIQFKIPSAFSGGSGDPRPSLSEATSMFQSLRIMQTVKKRSHYTLLAIMWKDEKTADAQQVALDALRPYATKLGLQLIEVRVTR
jgi:hypothetical protein